MNSNIPLLEGGEENNRETVPTCTTEGDTVDATISSAMRIVMSAPAGMSNEAGQREGSLLTSPSREHVAASAPAAGMSNEAGQRDGSLLTSPPEEHVAEDAVLVEMVEMLRRELIGDSPFGKNKRNMYKTPRAEASATIINDEATAIITTNATGVTVLGKDTSNINHATTNELHSHETEDETEVSCAGYAEFRTPSPINKSLKLVIKSPDMECLTELRPKKNHVVGQDEHGYPEDLLRFFEGVAIPDIDVTKEQDVRHVLANVADTQEGMSDDDGPKEIGDDGPAAIVTVPIQSSSDGAPAITCKLLTGSPDVSRLSKTSKSKFVHVPKKDKVTVGTSRFSIEATLVATKALVLSSENDFTTYAIGVTGKPERPLRCSHNRCLVVDSDGEDRIAVCDDTGDVIMLSIISETDFMLKSRERAMEDIDSCKAVMDVAVSGDQPDRPSQGPAIITLHTKDSVNIMTVVLSDPTFLNPVNRYEQKTNMVKAKSQALAKKMLKVCCPNEALVGDNFFLNLRTLNGPQDDALATDVVFSRKQTEKYQNLPAQKDSRKAVFVDKVDINSWEFDGNNFEFEKRDEGQVNVGLLMPRDFDWTTYPLLPESFDTQNIPQQTQFKSATISASARGSQSDDDDDVLKSRLQASDRRKGVTGLVLGRRDQSEFRDLFKDHHQLVEVILFQVGGVYFLAFFSNDDSPAFSYKTKADKKDKWFVHGVKILQEEEFEFCILRGPGDDILVSIELE